MEKKKKLLLVDDIRECLLLVKHILSQDYEVITAEDGQQALEMMEQGACGYILKPFHPDELKENLRESLKNTLIPCS